MREMGISMDCKEKISIICIDCEPDAIDRALSLQTYENIEVVEVVTGKDFFDDVITYIRETDSIYVTFLEEQQILAPDWLTKRKEYMDRMLGAGAVSCVRNWVEDDGTIVSHSDKAYEGVFQECLFDGEQFLRECWKSGHNLYGNLTMLMIRPLFLQFKDFPMERYGDFLLADVQKAILLSEFLIGQKIAILEEPIVSTIVQVFNPDKLKAESEEYVKKTKLLCQIHGIENEQKDEIVSGFRMEHKHCFNSGKETATECKREITFFYTDKGEYFNLLPIMKEAQRRGYAIQGTGHIDQKAEIGVYCQHFGRPQNAIFSVVLLHDMAQGHNRWPNIWELERWNTYDIGIVPGNTWKDRWERSAFRYYTNPRCGTFELGYPKGDEVCSRELEERVGERVRELNFKYSFTVLYAPSWENDDKEDDFIRALSSLPVNLLIKQADWPEDYAAITRNIEWMRSLHEGKYENVYYLEPQESIMTAMKMCDVVVSDESSVMTEALLFHKPSIAVTDWLIPDTVPSRFASVPFDYVIKCKKVELREQIENFLKDGVSQQEVLKRGDHFFAEVGHASERIMDAVEYFTGVSENDEFLKMQCRTRYMPVSLWS